MPLHLEVKMILGVVVLVMLNGNGFLNVAQAGMQNQIGFYTQPNVTLVAGNVDGCGIINSNSRDARLSNPNAVAFDAAGNMYIGGGKQIRKVTPSGVVSTLAGNFNSNVIDGTGTGASLNSTYGLAIDNAGTLYFYDNDYIRKVTSAGVVTTIAGKGSFGGNDGSGSAAGFNDSTGVATDGAGLVYVADVDNQRIRKVTATGVVTTWAGWSYGYLDGTGTAAQFTSPRGIAVNSSTGDIYVADNYTIRKVTSTGVVTTLAGVAGAAGFSDGTGAAARFVYLNNLGMDSAGNIYAADGSPSCTVRKITPTGVVTTVVGTPGLSGAVDGTGTAARFYNPQGGIAIDSSGNYFVPDSYNHTIRKVTPNDVVTTLAGTGTNGFSDGTGTAAQFSNVPSMAIDSLGNLYVTDAHSIRKITAAGVVTTLAGVWYTSGSTNGTGTAALFNTPQGIAIDGSNNLYVSDSNNNKIRKVTTAGVVTTFVGADTSGLIDGNGTAARFSSPKGLTILPNGTIYVIDSGNNLIRKITSAGVVSTFVGNTQGEGVTLGSIANPNTAIGGANGIAYYPSRLLLLIQDGIVSVPLR